MAWPLLTLPYLAVFGKDMQAAVFTKSEKNLVESLHDQWPTQVQAEEKLAVTQALALSSHSVDSPASSFFFHWHFLKITFSFFTYFQSTGLLWK